MRPIGLIAFWGFPLLYLGFQIDSASTGHTVHRGLPVFLAWDAIAIAVILFHIGWHPATRKRWKKTAWYWWGASGAVLLLVYKLPQAALIAALHFFKLRETMVPSWFETFSVILVLIAALIHTVVIFAWTYSRGAGKVVLKRGVNISPLQTVKNEQAIVVGTFSPSVLSADVRQFAEADEGDAISLPLKHLTRGTSIFGDPGSGKSRLMKLLHDDIRRLCPDIPILIHDPKGEWLRTCYDPATDLIFAPYDKRSVGWDIFREIEENPQILASIVSAAVSQHLSAGSGENAFWANSAMAIIQEQLESATDLVSFRDGLLHWREVHDNDKTALSAYSSARPAIRDIATIAFADGHGGKRTMAQFLNHRGRIFLLNSPMQSTEQSGAFAIFLSAFILSCLSRPDSQNPRACAIVDEALTFHLPPVVEQMVSAQARSKGLITITGAQWIPKDERRLLTRAEFVFGMKVADLPTARTLSDLAGHLIYDEETKSTSQGGKNPSTTTSMQERKRQLVAPEHFRSLPQRSFVLLHQAGIATGYTAPVSGDQRDGIPAFDYQPQPLVSEYMKIL